jgi:hypothetical protein
LQKIKKKEIPKLPVTEEEKAIFAPNEDEELL